METIEIKSCDDATTLSLRIVGGNEEGSNFVASVTGAPFIGEVNTTTYFVGPPSLLFRDMADNWRGWKGEKIWGALDGEFMLTATATSLGRITVIIEMVEMAGAFRLKATLGLEAGQLENISKRVESLFPLENH
ncbi:DUF6228 family protein [Marinobacter vinifirmus]|uniref:Uncharacterized protein n=1 Tax=Marinobacter vinifirmus TaxID=355591 RepID=A0A558B1C4_9GAMM|nr:DUF6228 family protein [Marinobacter vinifirmus]TVT30321.1 MAG: hypothetical protein FHK81_16995 [Marinobacter vinifirmus]